MKVDLLRIERIEIELDVDGLLDMAGPKGKGWTVQAIDDKDFIGFCHSCERPVLEGDGGGNSRISGLLYCEECL